jgi:hypothetical protein
MFLTAEGLCSIHAVAPYACAFFDWHMPRPVADQRSCRGLQTVLDAWVHDALYAQVWAALYKAGLVALPPEVGRQRLQQVCPEKKRM